MITHSRSGHMLVELGQGDMCIDFGKDEGDGVAYLALREQPVQTELEVNFFDGKVFANALDYPLILSFSNRESIDAMIRALEQCKGLLEPEK